MEIEIECKNLGDLLRAIGMLSEKFRLNKKVKIETQGVIYDSIIITVNKECDIWIS